MSQPIGRATSQTQAPILLCSWLDARACLRKRCSCGWLAGSLVTSNSGTKMLSSICSKFSMMPCSLYTAYRRGICARPMVGWGLRIGFWGTTQVRVGTVEQFKTNAHSAGRSKVSM